MGSEKDINTMKKRIFLTVLLCCSAIFLLIGANSIIEKKELKRKQKEQPSTMMSMKEIKLPPPSHIGEMSVEQALQTRRSIRSFSNQALSIEQVSQLLWATYGVSYVSSSGARI
jgi:hypothetical protein